MREHDAEPGRTTPEDSVPEEIADATGVEVGTAATTEPEATAPGWVNPTGTSGTIELPSTEAPTYKVTVDGQEVEVSLDEALQGYQRQSDYTRKTQELASQREELSFAQRVAEALEADPARAIEALREAYGVQGAAQVVAEAENLDPEQQRVASLEARIAAQESAAFERQLSAQLTDLHTQFGAFDDVELVRFAVDRNIPDLQDAAKVFTFDRTFTKVTADRAAAAAKGALPPVAGGHTVASGSVAEGAAIEKPTIQQALAAAFAAHGAS